MKKAIFISLIALVFLMLGSVAMVVVDKKKRTADILPLSLLKQTENLPAGDPSEMRSNDMRSSNPVPLKSE